MADVAAPLPPSPAPSSPPGPPPAQHAPPSVIEPLPDAAKATSHLDRLVDQPQLAKNGGGELAPTGEVDLNEDEQPIAQHILDAVQYGDSEEGGAVKEKRVPAALAEQTSVSPPSPSQDDDAQYLVPPTMPRSASFDPYGEPTPPAVATPLPSVYPSTPPGVSSASPAAPASPASLASAAVDAPPKLGLSTHPADLCTQANPDPHGASVPGTPISPTAGDAGHGDSLSLLGHGSHAGHAHETSSSTAGSAWRRRTGSEATSAEEGGGGSRRQSMESARGAPLSVKSGGAGGFPPSDVISENGGTAGHDDQVFEVEQRVEEDATVRMNGFSRSAPHPSASEEAEGDDAVESLRPSVTARPPPPSSYDPSTPLKRHTTHGRAQSVATGSPSTSTHASHAYARGADLLFSPASPATASPSHPVEQRPRSASTTAPFANGHGPGGALPSVLERSSAGADVHRSASSASTSRRASAPVPPEVAGGPSRQPSVSSSAAPSRRESTRRDGREREKSREEQLQGGSGRSRRQLGEWQMTKTLGAGSMGKVKLGVSTVTGDKVAIKIIPRFTSTASAHRQAESRHAQSDPSDPAAPPPKPTASFLAKAAAKDASKEVRTHHYYFVQEYVNGGQMLDYIISHGRLRERSARKFARQIGSALEYCHANSIVHRDLKIENILISKTGNIKIIDFGLSNLYSPVSHLSTFCGSLYFAAPELLNAKPYTGPEVDVWSFGIVLYVLVCGKVPFDDQSMPALHAKIKRGQVEYPTWLSAECKHLLSRMLVTVPSQRATLTEVLAHPWMVKGFTGPPAPHIPSRAPLRFGELDDEVLRGMTGFEFGTEGEIAAKLGDVLQSDLYRQAVRNWEARRGSFGPSGNGEASDSDKERPAMRTDGRDMMRSPSSANKRFSGLGFYGKKLAGGFNAAFAGTGVSPRASDDLDALAAAGAMGGGSYGPNGSFAAGGGTAPRPDQLDPTRGFHPLISIYYLVKEKIERERIWGPGVFASSTLSLTGPPPPPAPAQAYQAGAILASPPPMASPLVPMTPQPRQRATGEEFAAHPSTAPQIARPTTAHDYPSPASAKRATFAPTASSPLPPSSQPPTPVPSVRPQTSYEPQSPSPRERKASNRMSLMLGGGGASEREREQHSQPHVDDIPLSSSASGGGFARRFGSLLGRSSPTPSSPDTSPASRGHRTRASIGGMGHKASNKTAASPLPQVAEGLAPPSPTPGSPALPTSGSDVPLASPPDGKPVHRASTVGETSPARHQRVQSMGAAAFGQSQPQAAPGSLGRAGGGFFERRRQSSMSSSTRPPRPRTQNDIAGMFDETAEEELADVEPSGGAAAGNGDSAATRQEHELAGRTQSRTSGGKENAPEKSEGAKPVWLKGLFSVSTTSTKPIATLRADLVTVLDRLGVQHRAVKNGFECAHSPSIDLSSVGTGGGATGHAKEKTVRGTIKRRASKLLLSGKDGEKHSSAPDESQSSLQASTIVSPTHGGATAGEGESSTSFTPVPLEGANGPSSAINSPTAPGSSRFADSSVAGGPGATGGQGGEMVVRFEIFLVKMPLLPGIHGLQFRRIGGNSWQYQMLARRVLQELKL
ncbi:Serine/threonine-protein kinase [Rhodosporidiobolus nylandii]